MALKKDFGAWRKFIFEEDDPSESAKIFTSLISEPRPSLMLLAESFADHLQLDVSCPLRQAMMNIAFEAEINEENDKPAYHSTEHYFHVAATAAKFSLLNNRLHKASPDKAVEFDRESQALIFIAALGHDRRAGLVGQPQDGRHLLDAENDGQFARFGAELHILLHLITIAGHREKEPERNDARVEC